MINDHLVVSSDVLIEKEVLAELASDNIVSSADLLIELPKDIGDGCSYSLDLNKQTKLMLTEVDFYQSVTFDSDKNSMCGAFIVLEGELSLAIADQAEVTVSNNSMVLFFLNDSKCQCTYRKGRTKLINFSIDAELMAILAQQCQDSPVNQNEQGQLYFENCLWTMPIIPDVSTIIKQIYNSQLAKTANKIYLQAKVMEVITLAFHWYKQQKSLATGLTHTDFKRIINAAKVMENKMANPPSLAELARLVGINDNKLKKQFKLVFKKNCF